MSSDEELRRLRGAAREHHAKAPTLQDIHAEIRATAQTAAKADLRDWIIALDQTMESSKQPILTIKRDGIYGLKLFGIWGSLPHMEPYCEELTHLLGSPFRVVATRREVTDVRDPEYPCYFEMTFYW